MNHNTEMIILAAGRGTRLGELGEQTPKALIRTGHDSETLISRMITQFSPIVDKITVVMGHRKDLLQPYLKSKYPKVHRIYNEFYSNASNLISLAPALSSVKSLNLIIADVDTYLSEEAASFLTKIIPQTGYTGIIFTTNTKRPKGEWAIISDDNRYVKDIRTDAHEGDLVTSGITYFTQDTLTHLKMEVLKAAYSQDKDIKYWDDIYLRDFLSMQLSTYLLPGFVGEVDTPEDIETIRRGRL